MGICGSRFPETESISRRSYKGQKLLGKVSRVIDGDTIEVICKLPNEPCYLVPIRVYGVDTPEKGSNGSKKSSDLEKEAGRVVTDVVKGHAKQFPYVEVEFVTSDKYYGREVAKLVFGEISCFGNFVPRLELADYLIKSHLALPYEGKTKDEFTDKFLKNIVKDKEVILKANVLVAHTISHYNGNLGKPIGK